MAEVEIKYLVHDAALLDRLGEASEIDGFRVESRKSIEQTDEYWDTPDSAAVANKMSIRRRQSNGEWKHTVKIGAVTGGFSRRVEIEEPAGEAGLAEWLETLAQDGRIELPFLPRDLAPALSVRNRRTTLDLVHTHGPEIELALDRVTFIGPRGEVSEMELEGELVSGDESALTELRNWLLAQGGLTPSHASKYERAREVVG